MAVDGARPHLVADVEVVAVPVLQIHGELALGPGAADLEAALSTDLMAVLEAARATGVTGEITSLPIPEGLPSAPALRLVLLVGLGSGDRVDFRRAGAALARACAGRTTVATTIPAVDPSVGLEACVVGVVLGSFGFQWRSSGPKDQPPRRVVFAELSDGDAEDVRRAAVVAGASWEARRLASVPSNLKNPVWLTEQAVALAADTGVSVTVWDEQRLAKEGFGGIVGVGRASANPPRLIRLDYAPRGSRGLARRSAQPIVLVGKGITFDSGGLSIKPGQAMANMKRDMTGGGVVIATMTALAALDCPHPVVGLVAAAENSISGDALRPGDVIRHWNGRTSEVTNTDAEGRLVMADAMAYAAAELDPLAIVDIATLTGAIKVALGQTLGGIFANDDALAHTLIEAGGLAGEPMWRMPLASAYEDKVGSRVADADNAGGGPGAITAALFLQHFVDGVPWAHLDIASAGDAPEESFEWSQGPTGFGARLLLTWLCSEDPLAGVGERKART